MKALYKLIAITLLATGGVEAQSLQGSGASVARMAAQARAHRFDHMRDAAMVRRYVDAGYLVPVRNSAHFYMSGVSYPYARPATRLWIERFSSQYFAYCGERIVVTSILRPTNSQPRNASDRSVHPTGMAVDLRVPQNARCRGYLERSLLEMERSGIIEATRERNPPHYHIAVYSNQYTAYVAARTGSARTHVVVSGENLTTIARRYGVSISAIRGANSLSGDRIRIGQRLTIPRS